MLLMHPNGIRNKMKYLIKFHTLAKKIIYFYSISFHVKVYKSKDLLRSFLLTCNFIKLFTKIMGFDPFLAISTVSIATKIAALTIVTPIAVIPAIMANKHDKLA